MRNTPLTLDAALAYVDSCGQPDDPEDEALRTALRSLLRKHKIVVLDSGAERGLVFMDVEWLAHRN